MQFELRLMMMMVVVGNATCCPQGMSKHTGIHYNMKRVSIISLLNDSANTALNRTLRLMDNEIKLNFR